MTASASAAPAGDVPRTLLFTGKGGVGKTTVAAATAVHAARGGRKTLVLSTDAAHSLGDALGHPLGPEPTEVEPGLYAQQVDPRVRLEQHWRTVQQSLLEALDELGVDPAAAEEMTVLPAAEEVLALLELRDQVRAGRWDLVVVDCAPTAETLRLLALPEALSGYLSRAVPVGRRVARAMRSGLVGSGAGDPVLSALRRLAGELADVRDVLTSPATSVRLVLTAESVVLAEARRTLTALALFGYPVDGCVVNRLVPDGDDPWRAARARRERDVLEAARESFGSVALLECPRHGHRACGRRRARRARRRALRRRWRGGGRRPLRGGRACHRPWRSSAAATTWCWCCGSRWPTGAPSTWPGVATTSS